jgi:hypothetical protein
MRRFVPAFLVLLALAGGEPASAGEAASAGGPRLQFARLRGSGFLGTNPTFYVSYVISACPGECLLKNLQPTARLYYRHKLVGAFLVRSRTKSYPSSATLTGSFQVKPAFVLCGPVRKPRPGRYTVVAAATVLGPEANYRVSDARSIWVSCS